VVAGPGVMPLRLRRRPGGPRFSIDSTFRSGVAAAALAAGAHWINDVSGGRPLPAILSFGAGGRNSAALTC